MSTAAGRSQMHGAAGWLPRAAASAAANWLQVANRLAMDAPGASLSGAACDAEEDHQRPVQPQDVRIMERVGLGAGLARRTVVTVYAMILLAASDPRPCCVRPGDGTAPRPPGRW